MLPVIIGVSYLSILRSKKYNQELWIFGESHKQYDEKDCKTKPNMTFLEYFSTLLAKGRPHDVFVEIYYNPERNPEYKIREGGSKNGGFIAVNNLLVPCYEKKEYPRKLLLGLLCISVRVVCKTIYER